MRKKRWWILGAVAVLVAAAVWAGPDRLEQFADQVDAGAEAVRAAKP